MQDQKYIVNVNDLPDPATKDVGSLIDAAASKYGVPADFLHSLARVESGGNQRARSSKGAIGVMQLMPDTAKRFGANPFRLEENVDAGARYAKFLLDRYKGDRRLAAAGYNAGEGAVDKYGGIPPYKETQNHVLKVEGKRFTVNLNDLPDEGTVPAPSAHPQAAATQTIDTMLNTPGPGETPPRRVKQQQPSVDQLAAQFEAIKAGGQLNKLTDDERNAFLAPLKRAGWEVGKDYIKPPVAAPGAYPLWENQLAQQTGAATPAHGPNWYESTVAGRMVRSLFEPVGGLIETAGKTIGAGLTGNASEAVKQGYSLTLQPQVEQFKQAAELYKQRGKVDTEVMAHALAGVIPFTGPIAVGFSEKIGQGIGKISQGDKSGYEDLVAAVPDAVMLVGPLHKAFKAMEKGTAPEAALADVAEKAKPLLVQEASAVPESPVALNAQMEALTEGRGTRKAVMVTPGETPPEVPEGFVTTKTPAGDFIHDPKVVSPGAVKMSVKNGTFHELLGITEPKSAETVQAAVVARDAKGNELQTALASEDGVAKQVSELKAQYPDAEITVEHPAKVVLERLRDQEEGGQANAGQRPASIQPETGQAGEAYRAVGGEAGSATEGGEVNRVRDREQAKEARQVTSPESYAAAKERLLAKQKQAVEEEAKTAPEVTPPAEPTSKPKTGEEYKAQLRAEKAAKVEKRKAVLGTKNVKPQEAPSVVQEAAPQVEGKAVEPQAKEAVPEVPKAERITAAPEEPSASWIIREKATGKAVMETYDPTVVAKLNKEKYEAVPALQHLREVNTPGSLARQAAEEPTTVPQQVEAPKVEAGGKEPTEHVAAKEVAALPPDRLVSVKDTYAAASKPYFNERGEKISSSRTLPAGEYPYKPGDWRIDEHFGTRGREVEKLVLLDPKTLRLSEDDYTVSNVEGRGYDADRYAKWMKEGKVAPPINVVQTDEGNFKVTDGHRRVAAAKKANQQILAWVSYRMDTGRRTPEGKPIYTGLTYEGAVHGPERAATMWEERQNTLRTKIAEQQRAAPESPKAEVKPLVAEEGKGAAEPRTLGAGNVLDVAMGDRYRKDGFWYIKGTKGFMGGADMRVTDPRVQARFDAEYEQQKAVEPAAVEPTINYSGPRGGKVQPKFEVGERVQAGNSVGVIESVTPRFKGHGPKGAAYEPEYKIKFDSGDLRDAGTIPMAERSLSKAEVKPEQPKGTRAVAQRIVNAENGFIGYAMEKAGLTKPQAETALARYKKDKAIKIDPVGGQYAFTHGGFAEADVLRRAAGIEEAGKPTSAKRVIFEGAQPRVKGQRPKQPKSLFDIIKQNGGINLGSSGEHAWFRQGERGRMPGLFRTKGGMAFDEAHDTLNAYGYHFENAQDLAAALEAEARGNRQYPSETLMRQGEVAEPLAPDLKQAYDLASEHLFDDGKWTAAFDKVTSDAEPTAKDIRAYAEEGRRIGLNDEQLTDILYHEARKRSGGITTEDWANRYRAATAENPPRRAVVPSKETLTTDQVDRVKELHRTLQEQGTSVDDYLRQGGLFGKELNPAQQDLLKQIDTQTRRTPLKTEQGAMFETTPTVESRLESYGSRNKGITKEAADTALENFKQRQKTQRGSGGLSTEDWKDLATVAAYHIEAGAREFPELSKKMVEDIGEWVKPHLEEAHRRALELLGQTEVKKAVEKLAPTPKSPAIAEAERRLPKTLDAAQLEKGENLTYSPQRIIGDAGRRVVQEKGVDGAIEHVLHGDAGIEWASTGYAAMEEMRKQETRLRQTDPIAADEVAAKRLKFVGDFAEAATKRGQSIAGVKAIEEFAPDRAVYTANKLSQKFRKRSLSPEEDSRITQIGNDLQMARDRIAHLETALEAAKGRTKQTTKVRPTYQTKLDEQALTAKATLAAHRANLDFGELARTGERGAVRIGEPPLPGDAELLAQYAASRLNKLNTVAELNAEMTKEFGSAVEPHLPAIRRRALAIREEARLAEIKETPMERRRTILQEIQQEVTDRNKQFAEARQEQKRYADTAARVRKIQEGIASDAEVEFQRERLLQARRESVAASKAAKEAYYADVRTQREAARTAQMWDTPLRKEAAEAQKRLVGADPKAPETMDDLVSVTTGMLLPDKPGGVAHMKVTNPAKIYADLKHQYPDLVTRDNQGQIYKRAYQRVKDMTAAAREAARLRSATSESQQMWEKLGLDTDAQAILIKRAEAQRQRLEAESAMTREFDRLNRSKLGRLGFELQAIPRALESSIDAPLGRQGLFYAITHPVLTMKYAVPATWKGYAALRRGDFQTLVEDLQRHPDYELAHRSGVDLPGIAGEVDPRVAAEEAYQSTWAERLPHVRLSEQGFVHGMNAQRLAVFSKYADFGRANGYTWENNPAFFKQAAELVNSATGRGNMPEVLKRATAITNALFYSTRLQISRVQLLNNLFDPIKYFQMDPAMRRIAAGEAIKMAAGMALIYGTAKAAGLKVSVNPDDPDFGKIVWGKVHYDVTAGEAALVRTAWKIIRGAAQRANGEQVADIDNPISVLGHYARQKLAPWPGTVLNLAYGKDVTGTPTNAQREAIRMVEPMIVGDFIDAYQQEGWAGVGKITPGLTGIGTQAYTPNEAAQQKREMAATRKAVIEGLRTNPKDLNKLNDLLKKGLITNRQYDEIRKEAATKPVELEFKRKGLEQKLQTFRAASPELKKELKPLLDEAWDSAEGGPKFNYKTGKLGKPREGTVPEAILKRLREQYAQELR